MICICKKQMELLEEDMDNCYIRYACYTCECGVVTNLTWYGSSEEPEVEVVKPQ